MTWHKLRAALTTELTGASTVFSFFPALNIVTDDFIELIRKGRKGIIVKGFEEIAHRMGLESKSLVCFLTYHELSGDSAYIAEIFNCSLILLFINHWDVYSPDVRVLEVCSMF